MKILILFFTLAIIPFSYSNELEKIEWKTISQKEGIIVFKPKSYKHKSGLVPIRFKAILNHKVERVLTVLADELRKKEWLPKAKEVKLLEKNSAADFVGYYRYYAPWPFQDREFVLSNKGVVDTKAKTIYVDIKSIDHEKAPKKSGITRGITHVGFSKIRPLEGSKTEVEMGLLTEFGGLIPNWIINIVQKKWPYSFMKNLRKQLKKTDLVINPDFVTKSDKSSQ